MLIIYYERRGGESASTGIRKLKLHTEVLSARKTGGNNLDADDYAYALAA
jgi:hypothetical protein